MKPLFLALATLSLVLPLCAADEPLQCGTSPELVQWVHDFGAWSDLRVRAAAAKGLKPAPAALRDNLFLVPGDDFNSPWRHRFDLEGRSLRFTRRGETGFAVSVEDLQYDGDTGIEVITSSGDGEYGIVSLDFDFPFFDRTVRAVYPSDHNAIFIDVPESPVQRQYGDLDLVTERRGVIAPLLTTIYSQFGPRPTVRMKRSSQSVAITWSVFERYDVQAVLYESGDILFSYRQVTSSIAASGIVVGSGNEAWRS
ncbi:MAG: hypothetical protein ACREV8_13715, partial [Gammaproteobacteria bacterium]